MALTWKAPQDWTWTNTDRHGAQIKQDVTRLVSDAVDHGIKDAKGRAIGNYAVIDAMRKVRRNDDGTLTLEDATTYFVSTRATRDGKSFGAINTRDTECASLTEAQAVAEKKIAAAGKRFARAAAKGEGRQFAKAGA